jgi:rhodanese-related sulfurtransferase
LTIIPAAQEFERLFLLSEDNEDMKPLTFMIAFILIFCGQINGQTPDSVKFISLHPNDFYSAYKHEEKATLIDVREFFEFRRTRIKGARNIPSSGNLDYAADTLDKESGVFLYCSTGYRSKRVAIKLYDKGFHNVYSLDGGITAWKKEGLAVEKNKLRK